MNLNNRTVDVVKIYKKSIQTGKFNCKGICKSNWNYSDYLSYKWFAKLGNDLSLIARQID